jgi:hypothetical protein
MKQEKYFKEIAKITHDLRVEKLSLQELGIYRKGEAHAYMHILGTLDPELKEFMETRLHSRLELENLCTTAIRNLQERLTRAKDIFRKLRAENDKLRQWELPF